MKLRRFLWILAVNALIASVAPYAAEPAGSTNREYYELRVYTTANVEQQALISDYWEKAAIPAYNRAGVQQIGVFTEEKDSATNSLYVLIPFQSLRALEELPVKLAADGAYQTASSDFMNRSKDKAPYKRIDSTLLQAMIKMPKLAAPPSSATKEPWIFELRTYFSPTEAKGANKIDMFNAGEVDVMKEVGLHPVFFAGAVVGTHLPKLVYMTSGRDTESYKAAWKGFGPHPLWKKLSGDPQYKDNMTGIQSVFLKRTKASQL